MAQWLGVPSIHTEWLTTSYNACEMVCVFPRKSNNILAVFFTFSSFHFQVTKKKENKIIVAVSGTWWVNYLLLVTSYLPKEGEKFNFQSTNKIVPSLTEQWQEYSWLETKAKAKCPSWHDCQTWLTSVEDGLTQTHLFIQAGRECLGKLRLGHWLTFFILD